MNTYLTGLLPREIAAACGFDRPFRGTQVFKWLCRGALSFEDMTNVSALERERLTGLFPALLGTSIDGRFQDEDGTVKLRLRLNDGAAVETVLLTDIEGRKTACISTQVGCPMACAFCKTGTLGFLRNLEAFEIVEQFLHLNRLYGRPSNLVFMGMGEPLLNLAEVRKSIDIFSHPDGLGLSLRKITISTCGLPDGIRDLADKGPHARLAVSLTSAVEATRCGLMPVNRTHGLEELRESLVYYQAKTNDRITLEAVLIGGQNDRPEDAQALIEWARPLRVQVNLIPWNPVPDLPYREPSRRAVEDIVTALESAGIPTTRRMRRGRGVLGACGQLGEILPEKAAPPAPPDSD